MHRPVFSSPKEYGRTFTKVDYWQPYVEYVCNRHGLGECSEIRAGLPGTHPVFIVDRRFVVKLYTNFFNGESAQALEVAVYSLLAKDKYIPAPTLIAHGSLFERTIEWHWPYIVTSLVTGVSYGEEIGSITHEDQLQVAGFAAQALRRIHALPVERSTYLVRSWNEFSQFLSARRTEILKKGENWVLPPHLASQLEGYLSRVDHLFNVTLSPHLLHCDLNRDHILGAHEQGKWRVQGIIDFADAKVGDRLYELVALHIGLFNCDKRLLGAFLEECGQDEEITRNFVERAMCYTLLHEYDIVGELLEEHPKLGQAQTLGELARHLWDVNVPGTI